MYYLSLYCFFVVFFRFVLLLCITGLQVDFFKIKVLMLNEKHACSTAATYVEEIFSIESLLRPESSVQEENLTQLNLFSYEFVGTVSVPLIPRNTLSFCLLLLTQPPRFWGARVLKTRFVKPIYQKIWWQKKWCRNRGSNTEPLDVTCFCGRIPFGMQAFSLLRSQLRHFGSRMLLLPLVVRSD